MESQLQQVTEHCDTLTQRYEEATNNLQKLQELLKESDYDRHQLKGRNQILEQQVVLFVFACVYIYRACSVWSRVPVVVIQL